MVFGIGGVSMTYLYRLMFVFLMAFFVTYLCLSHCAGADDFIEIRSLRKAVVQFYRDGLVTGDPKDLYYYLDINKERLIFDESTVYIKR